MDTTVKAAANPALANELANQAMAPQVTVGVPEEPFPAPLPPDSIVRLAAGWVDPITDEVVTYAELRELNGADEEALAKITDLGKSLLAVLQRGVVKIGEDKATPELVDQLLAGDRELILMGIRKITFGKDIKLGGTCPSCGDVSQEFDIDLEEDVEIRRLEDPVNDRYFVIEGKAGTIQCTLPTGKTQKRLVSASDKTTAELDSILLKDCVLEINDMPVMDIKQVLGLSISDRRTIINEIGERNPGPRLGALSKDCSACGAEVPLPLTVADLFRL